MKVEYKVRSGAHYHVTRFVEDGPSCGSSTRGEYDNPDVAYEVAYALCKAEHERLGYPPGDERIQYPEPISRPRGATDLEYRHRIAAEIDRLHTELGKHLNANDGREHPGLVAAQQALCWALDPDMVASPFNMILRPEGPSLGESFARIGKGSEPLPPPPTLTSATFTSGVGS